MGKRKKSQVTPLGHNPTWVVTESVKINGRLVEPKTELSIRGESGRFLFVKHVKTPDSEWIDVIGGKSGYKMFRSFEVDKVKTVHYKNRTRGNTDN